MANCLKKLAIRVVNLIVNEAHYEAVSIAKRSLRDLERYQLSNFWNEKGFGTIQKLAPVVLGLPMEELDPPCLQEDHSYLIESYEKKINIFCSPTTIRAVVHEGERSGEHSVNPYIVWKYLRNMHGFTLTPPTELEMTTKALHALERKPNRTPKQEKKLQTLRTRYRKLYGEASQRQRDYVDNVVLGGGQRIDSSDDREYLCGRIQYLTEFPTDLPLTDLPLLDMYIRELQMYDNGFN